MTADENLPLTIFAGWLASGERGLSSEAIVSNLTGQHVGRYWHGGDHPYDPSDFRRCELLLREVPIARLMFHRMAEVSPVWKALVEAWSEIVALMESEVPGVFETRSPNGRAPLAAARITQCREVAS